METEDITTRKSTTVDVYAWIGHVELHTIGKHTTFCPLNLRYFPFDKHICQIHFILTTRFGANFTSTDYNDSVREGVVFQKSDTNQQFLVENREWELVSLELDTEPEITAFGETIMIYPMYTITLKLERKPSFYVMILMLPSILISLISVIGFLLPSESGEKVSLKLTALLSYSLVFLVIVDIIPPVGGNFPLNGKCNQSLFQTHLEVILSNISVKFQSIIFHLNFQFLFIFSTTTNCWPGLDNL